MIFILNGSQVKALCIALQLVQLMDGRENNIWQISYNRSGYVGKRLGHRRYRPCRVKTPSGARHDENIVIYIL